MKCTGIMNFEKVCNPDLLVTDSWQTSVDLPVVFVSVSNIKKL